MPRRGIKKKFPSRKEKVFVSDYTIDITATLTSVAILSWAGYIVTLDKYTPLVEKKKFIYTVVAVMILHLITNLCMIVREILDNRFRFAQWKWLLLLHSVVVVMGLIWTLRSVSASNAEWCRKSYRPIFGLLLSTTTIYLLSIILYGPAASKMIRYLRKIYNMPDEKGDSNE